MQIRTNSKIINKSYQVFAYADNINITGGTIQSVKEVFMMLEVNDHETFQNCR